MRQFTAVTKPLILALGSTLALPALAEESPFHAQPVSPSTWVAADDHAGGEGKCGADKSGQEGKCGGDKQDADKKKEEGKCGEGKCGGKKH